MKHCDEYSELISAFIDNEISDAEAESLKAHLATCHDCRAYLLYLEKIHTETATLAQDVPDGFSSRVMNSIVASEKAQKRFGLSRFKFTAIAAAIILLVFAAGRLDSFFPTVAEDLSNEKVDEGLTQGALPQEKDLVPSTLTPLYTAENYAAPITDNDSNQKADTASDVNKKQIPTTERTEVPKLENTPPPAPPVENASNAAIAAPEQMQDTTVSDSSADEDALPPAQNIEYDENTAAPSEGNASAGGGSTTVENSTASDSGALPEDSTAPDEQQEEVTESDSSSGDSAVEETTPSILPMPAVPQSETYACYISVKGQGALSLFSEYSSNIYEGNYLISIDKANLANTLSLLDNSGFSYYRYDGDSAATNFLLIIIP